MIYCLRSYFPASAYQRHQDGSKRCKPTQCLYAAHAGTAARQEPVPGAACPQEPFSE